MREYLEYYIKTTSGDTNRQCFDSLTENYENDTKRFEDVKKGQEDLVASENIIEIKKGLYDQQLMDKMIKRIVTDAEEVCDNARKSFELRVVFK